MTTDRKEKSAQCELNGQTVYGALAVVVFCAFVLRFYRLGEPTLWYDEMWIALLSTKSLPYLVDQSLYFARGTPLEPLFFKAVSTLGKSDFAIRLFYALSGVGVVCVVFRIGERFLSRTTGVFAACFLALNYAHVSLSRIARTYSVLLLFFSIALYFTMKYHESEKRADYWLAAFFCLLFANLSFLGILLAFPLYCSFMAIFVLRKKGIRSKLASIAMHSALYLLIIMPSLFFLFAELTHGADGAVLGGAGSLALLKSLGTSMAELSTFFVGVPATFIVYSVALCGAIFLARTNRRILITLCWVAFVPLVLSFASGYIAFTSKYTSFLLVPLALLVGVFFDSIMKHLPIFCKRSAYIVLASATLIGSWYFVQKNEAWLYTEDNLETKNIFPVGLYKQIAKYIVRHVDSPFVAFNNNFLAGGVRWYFDQFSETNLASLQHVESQRESANFAHVYVYKDTDTSRLFSDLDRHGVAVDIVAGEHCNVAWANIRRDYFRMTSHVNCFAVNAFPYSSLRYAHELKNVTLDHHFGGVLVPTSYDDGLMEFWFYNELPASNYAAYLSLKYKNVAKNGRVVVRYALDDDAFVDLFTSEHGEKGGDFVGSISIARHFGILKLQFKVAADMHTAVGGIENFGLVGIKSFQLNIADSDHADIAFTNLLATTMPQGSISKAIEKQSVTLDGEVVSLDESGAEYFSPASKERAGSVTVALNNANGNFFFYPRVFGERDVISVVYAQNENIERVIFSIRGDSKSWTPVMMSVPLPPLGPSEYISLKLHGNAQLWAKDGKVIFTD